MLTIHDDKQFAILLCPKREEFAGASSDNAFRLADGFKNFQTVPSKLCMFFADVNPAFIR